MGPCVLIFYCNSFPVSLLPLPFPKNAIVLFKQMYIWVRILLVKYYSVYCGKDA